MNSVQLEYSALIIFRGTTNVHLMLIIESFAIKDSLQLRVSKRVGLIRLGTILTFTYLNARLVNDFSNI